MPTRYKMSKAGKTIWLAGGGTGGHISPLISIYEEFKKQGHNPLIITLEKNKTYPSIKQLDKTTKSFSSPVYYYQAVPIPKSFGGLLLFIRNTLKSIKTLKDLKKKSPPQAIMTFGGYPVFPLLLWSLFKKIPVFMHEQNAVYGLITRLFSFRAKVLFLSFPKQKYAKNEMLSGNPLRKIFEKSGASKKNQPAPNTKSNTKKIRKIFLIGGSQGASDINALYREMIGQDYFKGHVITVSAGQKEFKAVKKTARKQDFIYEFIEDIPGQLKSSDFIVSRSGSGMLYEILWSKKPALFIPFPYAAANHQRINAGSLARAYSAYQVYDQRPFKAKDCCQYLIDILSGDFLNTANPRNTGAAGDLFPLNAAEIIVKKIQSYF